MLYILSAIIIRLRSLRGSPFIEVPQHFLHPVTKTNCDPFGDRPSLRCDILRHQLEQATPIAIPSGIALH